MRSGLILAALLLFTALPLAAQEQDSLSSVVRRLQRTRSEIRLIAVQGDTLSGRITRITGDRMMLADESIAFGDIAAIQRRHSDSAAPWLAAGLGGLFGLIGYAMPCGGDYGPCNSDRYVAAGVGAAIGILAGVVVGEASARDQWRTLWRRE